MNSLKQEVLNARVVLIDPTKHSESVYVDGVRFDLIREPYYRSNGSRGGFRWGIQCAPQTNLSGLTFVYSNSLPRLQRKIETLPWHPTKGVWE